MYTTEPLFTKRLQSLLATLRNGKNRRDKDSSDFGFSVIQTEQVKFLLEDLELLGE
jgi:hypothetical protein